MKKSLLILCAILLSTSPAIAGAPLIKKMAQEFLNMPESSLEDAKWSKNVRTVDIETVPAAVVTALLAQRVLPSYDEDVNKRLVRDMRRARHFSFFVRESLVLLGPNGRIAGYAFAIDECTVEECYGFYGLYFQPNGKLVAGHL